MNEINAETTITTSAMAALLGVSERTLQNLHREGWISGKLGRDLWRVIETTQSYLAHVRLSALTKSS